VLLVLVIGALVSPDRLTRLALLLDPNVIAAILVAEVAFLVWRVIAFADAFRRGTGRVGERGAALTALGLVFVLVPSAYAAYLTNVAREAAIEVFAPVEQEYNPVVVVPVDRDDDDFAPIPTDEQPGETSTPAEPTDAPELGRYTVLLLGTDAGPDRSHALTDTMIVASLDPVAGAVSMVSVPRDLVDLPLPDGRVFRPKVNGLVSYFHLYPNRFPGATSGEAVLAAGLGRLLGVHVDAWAKVNLPGFVKVIDTIGGVDVTVRKAFCDGRYDEYGFHGFAINPGHYHLDGEGALAYARVRKAAGENDFTRAARQGEIVVAARDQVVKGGFATDPAGFIDAMGKLLQTSIDPSEIGEYIPLAATIKRDHMYRAVIQYPLVHGATNDPRGSILVPRLSEIRALGAQAFPVAGTLPVGLETIPEESDDPTKTKLPPVTCYAAPATPKPTSKPTVKPSTGSTPHPTNEATAPPPTDDPKPTPTPTPDPTQKPAKTQDPTAPTRPEPRSARLSICRREQARRAFGTPVTSRSRSQTAP
jgi:LCP family protein required for cell wall assembly